MLLRRMSLGSSFTAADLDAYGRDGDDDEAVVF